MTAADLTLLTPLPLSDPHDRADLLNLLGEHLPGCVPHRFGETEPLRQTWTGPESAAAFWLADRSVHWRGGTKPRCTGSVFRRTYDDDSHSQVDLVLGALPGPEGPAALRSMATRLAADYGHLHALTPAEVGPLLAGGVHEFNGKPRLYLTQFTVRRWLPALYWATVLGPPYVALIGADRIRSAPAYEVAELGPDRFYLQLTERLADVVEAPEEFAAFRAGVVGHLGADLFFDPARGENGPYRVPAFGADRVTG